MVLLAAYAVSSAASTATIGLQGSRHFVAFESAIERERERAASLHLQSSEQTAQSCAIA
jgi:hypothetical protein